MEPIIYTTIVLKVFLENVESVVFFNLDIFFIFNLIVPLVFPVVRSFSMKESLVKTIEIRGTVGWGKRGKLFFLYEQNINKSLNIRHQAQLAGKCTPWTSLYSFKHPAKFELVLQRLLLRIRRDVFRTLSNV